jgi:hypothetical protein
VWSAPWAIIPLLLVVGFLVWRIRGWLDDREIRGLKVEQAVCFVVRDHNGQQLAYVYFEDEPGRRSAAKLLSKDDLLTVARQYLLAGAANLGPVRL